MENIQTIEERWERLTTERRLLETALKKGKADERELRQRLEVCKCELDATQKRIEGVLGRISDPKLRNLLEARLLLKLTMEEIAEQMYMEPRSVYRLKIKAVDLFNRLLADQP